MQPPMLMLGWQCPDCQSLTTVLVPEDPEQRDNTISLDKLEQVSRSGYCGHCKRAFAIYYYRLSGSEA